MTPVNFLHGHPGPSETRPPIFCIHSSLGAATYNSRTAILSILDHVLLRGGCTVSMRPQESLPGRGLPCCRLPWPRAALRRDFSPDSMVKVCVHITPELRCGVCRILACPLQYSVATWQSWATTGSSTGISQPSLAQVHAALGECLSTNSTGQIEVA